MTDAGPAGGVLQAALQCGGCPLADMPAAERLLAALGNRFTESPVSAQLFAISHAKGAAASSAPSSFSSFSFSTALEDQVQEMLRMADTEQHAHPSSGRASSVKFKVPPSTLGFAFKYDCCPRYLHVACSVSSRGNRGRLQTPSFLRQVTLQGLLLEKGFVWEDDLEELLKNGQSPTCAVMRGKRPWWELDDAMHHSNASDFSTVTGANAPAVKPYTVVSLRQYQKKPNTHIQESLKALRESRAGTALVQTRFRVPQQMIDDLRRHDSTFDPGAVAFTTFLPDVVFVEQDPLPSHAEDGKTRRVLVVVDAKASSRVALSHKIQTSFYAKVLEYFVADVPNLRVASKAGVWRPATPRPETFELRSVLPQLNSFLRHDLCSALHRDCTDDDKTDHPEWNYNPHCEHCVTNCRQETIEDMTLSMLPKVSGRNRPALLSIIERSAAGAASGGAAAATASAETEIRLLHDAVMKLGTQKTPIDLETSQLIGSPLQCRFDPHGILEAFPHLQFNQFSPALDLLMDTSGTASSSIRVLCGKTLTSLPNLQNLRAVVHITVQKDYASDLIFGYSIQVRNQSEQRSGVFEASLGSVRAVPHTVLWGDDTKPRPPGSAWTRDYHQFLLHFCKDLTKVINRFSIQFPGRVLFATLTRGEKAVVLQVLREAAVTNPDAGADLRETAALCLSALSREPEDVQLPRPRSCGWCPTLPEPPEAETPRQGDTAHATAGEALETAGGTAHTTTKKKNAKNRPYLEDRHCHDAPIFVAIEEEANKCLCLPVPAPIRVEDLFDYVCPAAQELQQTAADQPSLYPSAVAYSHGLLDEASLVRDWRLTYHLSTNSLWHGTRRVEKLLKMKTEAADVLLHDLWYVLKHHMKTHYNGAGLHHLLPREVAHLDPLRPQSLSRQSTTDGGAAKSSAGADAGGPAAEAKGGDDGKLSFNTLNRPVLARLDYFTQFEGLTNFRAHQSERTSNINLRVHRLGHRPTAVVAEFRSCTMASKTSKTGWTTETLHAKLQVVAGDVSRIEMSGFDNGQWLVTRLGNDYRQIVGRSDVEFKIHLKHVSDNRQFWAKDNPNRIRLRKQESIGEHCFVDVESIDVDGNGDLGVFLETSRVGPSANRRAGNGAAASPGSASSAYSSNLMCWDALKRGDRLVLQPRFADIGSRTLCTHLERLDRAASAATTPSELPLFVRLHENMAQINKEVLNDLDTTVSADHRRQQQFDVDASIPLTTSQALIFQSVQTRHIQVVWGPPGSGKTYFSAATILRMMALKAAKNQPFRVLVTACTKLAIDNLLKKIVDLRDCAGLSDSCSVFSMDNDCSDQIEAFRSKKPDQRNAVFSDDRQFVIGATCYACGGSILLPFHGKFDLLLVDEGSQLRQNEFAVATSLLNSTSPAWRIVVVGDHLQMPPIVHNEYPVDIDGGMTPGVHVSVLDFFRFRSDEKGGLCMLLKDNHRMNAELCAFTRCTLGYSGYHICEDGGCSCRLRRSSHTFGPLRASSHLPLPNNSSGDPKHTEIAKQAIHSDKSVVCVEIEPPPTVCSREDMAKLEARLVATMVKEYARRSGVNIQTNPPFIVTPHHFQRIAICRALGLDPNTTDHVNTVEKMQGQENDLVIACYGFSNTHAIVSELDFVYDRHRLNVAASRAREKFVLVVSTTLVHGVKELMSNDKAASGASLFTDIKEYACSRESWKVCNHHAAFHPGMGGVSAADDGVVAATPRREPRLRIKNSSRKSGAKSKRKPRSATVGKKTETSGGASKEAVSASRPSCSRRLQLGPSPSQATRGGLEARILARKAAAAAAAAQKEIKKKKKKK
jgi:hypothetical protein